jgi:hypothetical protein
MLKVCFSKLFYFRILTACIYDATAIAEAEEATESSHILDDYTPRRGFKTGRHRAGVRTTLYERFKKPFWEWLKVMTEEDFASCSPVEQEYILKKQKGYHIHC